MDNDYEEVCLCRLCARALLLVEGALVGCVGVRLLQPKKIGPLSVFIHQAQRRHGERLRRGRQRAHVARRPQLLRAACLRASWRCTTHLPGWPFRSAEAEYRTFSSPICSIARAFLTSLPVLPIRSAPLIRARAMPVLLFLCSAAYTNATSRRPRHRSQHDCAEYTSRKCPLHVGHSFLGPAREAPGDHAGQAGAHQEAEDGAWLQDR